MADSMAYVELCHSKKTPANNVLSERKTAHILANEIEELYCRFGLKIVVRSTLILKVLKTKTDYYKSSGAIHEVKGSDKDIRLADARQCQCQKRKNTRSEVRQGHPG